MTMRARRWRLAAIDRRVLALAVPATAALAADPLLSLVDTALVGRLGPPELAALGISAAVFGIVFFAFNFLTYGTTARIAYLHGAGQGSDAARYAVAALWLAIGLGSAATLVLAAAAEPIVAVMGAGAEVAPPALTYLRIRALAAIPVLIVAVGHGAFRGLHNTRTPLRITVAANVANAAASYLLIYPAGLGIAGAAWGTVLAQTGAATAFLLAGRRALAVGDLGMDRSAMRQIARVSRDLFLRTASLLAALLVATAVAARMGTVTVAAHQIVREIWTLLALTLDGFAIAGQAMIGAALGARRPELAHLHARRLLAWGVGAGAVAGLLVLSLGTVLPRVFTDDPAVLAVVGTVWWMVAALQPLGGAAFILDGVLMGAGDYRFLLWSTALAALGGLLPVALLSLWQGWGLPGVWAGMALMMVLRTIATLWRLRDGSWSRVVPPPAPRGAASV